MRVETILEAHPRLMAAFYRFELMDANGASATVTDLMGTSIDGVLSDADAERIAREIERVCDALERECDE